MQTATTMRRRWLAVVAAGLAGAAAMTMASAAHSDWIVTKQGERFETKGPWKEKGKLLVFTLPNGNLSSIRTDRVDVAASQHATEQAKQQAEAPPPPPPEPPHRKAVIVLTDKDFQKSPPPAAEGDAAGAAGAAGSGIAGAAPADASKGDATAAKSANSAAAQAAAQPPHDGPSSVEVVSWERVPVLQSKANGAEINGTLRNASRDVVTEVNLVASLYDENGTIVAKVPATVETQVLPPTESSKFHLVADGVFTFSTIKWETQVKSLKGRPPGQPSTAGPPASPPS